MRQGAAFFFSAAALVLLCADAGAQSAPWPWPIFHEETSSRLVADPSVGTGDVQEKDYAWGDVDRDGDIDLVCVRKEPFNTPGRYRDVLFMNEGTAEGHALEGVLVDRTLEYATDASDGGQGLLDLTADRDVALVDVNADTWLDIVTATTYGAGLPKTISHPRVYINKGEAGGAWLGFRYEESLTPQMPIAPNFCGIAVGDVTGDGLPDLYFVDYNNNLEDRLWINYGATGFRDESVARMTFEMRESDFGVHAITVDVNGDGAADVIKDRGSTASTPPLRVSVSYNDPLNPGFFDTFDVVYTGNPYHIEVGHLNDDNLIDLVVEDDGTDRYFLNQGNGADGLANFISHTFSTESDSFGGNIAVEDVNNDGLNDVLVADVDVDCCGCTRYMRIWRNLGGGQTVSFDAQSGGIPISARTGTHDVAVFDVNRDGWRDLVIGTCTGTSVWIAEPVLDLLETYPDGLPASLLPGQTTEFEVRLTPIGAEVSPGSEQLFVSRNGGPFVASPLAPLGGVRYQATLPAGDCLDGMRFYTSAVVGGTTFVDPPGAPGSTYASFVASGTEVLFEDHIEADVSGWTIADTSVTGGSWLQAEPNGTLTGGGQQAAPDGDAEPEPGRLKAFVTGNGAPGGPANAADLDGGPTQLISPTLDLAGTDGIIAYHRWFFCDDFAGPDPSQADQLFVSLSNDNGSSWTPVENLAATDGWTRTSFRVGDFLPPTAEVRVRFLASDNPNNSITEAGLDFFRVERMVCAGGPGAGRVPDGGIVPGTPLRLGKQAGDLRLSWGSSCHTGDLSYGVYEGALGDFASHVARLCSSSQTTEVLTPVSGNTYYLVVPANGTNEGSYGTDSGGIQRPQGGAACAPQSISACGL